MINLVIEHGRLAKDPELRYTQSQTPVANFTIAVDRDFKSESGERDADFFNCIAWKGTADFVNKYFHKGDPIIVKGRLQARKYTDRDGNSRVATEIVAEAVYFAGSKATNDDSAQNVQGRGNAFKPAGGPVSVPYSDLDDMDDNELPF